jgi:hypothetical protein
LSLRFNVKIEDKTYHHEYSEQQSPYVEPKHVIPPKLGPHWPLLETCWAADVDDGAGEEVDVEVTSVDVV